MDARDPHTVVVGGGLAGLTAAASLARAGHPVTVLEAGERLGGRAHTRRRDGFELNLGPHAVYRAGGGRAVLRSLGVHVDGRVPKLHRAGFLAGGEVVPGLAHARHTGRPLEVLRALAGLGPRSLGPWEGRPATELVDALVTEPAGRDVIRSVLRTATYSGDLSRLDAGAAAHQLRTAMHGVLYLHHGWSSLVEQLADVIGRAGGRIRTRAAVEAVEHDARVQSVRLADGTTIGADAVVVAVHDARRVPALLDGPGREAVSAAVQATVPIRMAHLDLALRPLPQGRFPNVLGIDEPIYLTVQSDVADVAPPGGAVIHASRYLRPDEEDGDHRDAIEQALDVAQPGWRDHVVDARYVPRSMVTNDHARPATRGPLERPRVDVAGIAGLAVAGDWIGPAGTLADASILSGRAAATAITAMMEPTMRPTAVPA